VTKLHPQKLANFIIICHLL